MPGRKKNQASADGNKHSEKPDKLPLPHRKAASRWRSHGSKSTEETQTQEATKLWARLPWRSGRRCSADQASNHLALMQKPLVAGSPVLPPSPVLERVQLKEQHSKRRHTTPTGLLSVGISTVLQNTLFPKSDEFPSANDNRSAEEKKTEEEVAGSGENLIPGAIMEGENASDRNNNSEIPATELALKTTGSLETLLESTMESSPKENGGWFTAEHLLDTGYPTISRTTHRPSYRKAIQKAGYNMNELARTSSPMMSPMTMRKMVPKYTVDWTESAAVGEHLWATSNQTGDLCYVGEAFCKKSGPRKKCSACHIIVHDACLPLLGQIGFQCKVTFREASTRNLRENLTVRHHWVHRRRQDGKCKECGKVFERLFGFRDSKIVAISCSWCKEAYHNKVSCFRMHKLNERCTLGVHARIIIPPTWIVKWTPRGKSFRNRSKKKRAPSGIWKKKSSREGRSRAFVIRPLPEHTPYFIPTIVFINPKSGGNQGYKILQNFHWLLNQRQVFNLSDGGPKEALEMFKKVPNLRILACGGDGTVGWILATLDEMNLSRWPPVAILPLGTGNDLSRTLNWGPGYTDEPIGKILQHVEEGRVVQVDRWKLHVRPNPDAKMDEDEVGNGAEAVDQPPLSIVNNYFSLGADAKVALEFHESREAHPSKFNSRIGNKFFYVKTGVTDYLTAKVKNLGKSVSVVCDGNDITAKIQSLKPVCLLFLNIPRFSAGMVPWGTPPGSEFKPQRHDDKLIEVVAFTSNQLGLLYVGGHGERLCQCREATITTSRAFPIQIDGEPCRLNPSIIRLSFHNQANMIYKTKRRPIQVTAEHSVSEQMKICISLVNLQQYTKHNGDKMKLQELSKPSHTTVLLSDADLETVRNSIERMQQQVESAKGTLETSTEHYTFLDSNSGDRFYRIDRAQESLHLVREVITSDGEIFVLDCTPAPVPKPEPERVLTQIPFLPSPLHSGNKIAVRRRIQSDTTGSQLWENSQALQNFSLAVNSDRKHRATMTSKVDTTAVSKSSRDERHDAVDGPVQDDDVATTSSSVENVSDDRHVNSDLNDKSVVKGLFGIVTSEAKSNSLPSTLTNRGPYGTDQARPLSALSDVTNVSVPSTSSHCDVTNSSLKPNQASIPLCDDISSTVLSGKDHVMREPGDLSLPVATRDVTIATSAKEGVLSYPAMVPSPSSHEGNKLPAHETKSHSHEDDGPAQESESLSVEAPTSEVKPEDHRELGSHDNSKSLSRENNNVAREAESSLNHGDENLSAHESKSPAVENKSNSSEDSASIAQQAILHQTENRSSVARVPPSQKQNHSVKARSDTDEDSFNFGAMLSGFLNDAPSKGRSQTLSESVTTMHDSSKGDLHMKYNKQFADAAKRGDLQKLHMALENGADPMSLDGDGATALHNAARFNHPRIAQHIIINCPPQLLNQVDRDRRQTALHKAAWFGHKKVCEILVEAGASLTSVDYKGMTPLNRAQQAEDKRLEAFLAQVAVQRMQEDSSKNDKETDL